MRRETREFALWVLAAFAVPVAILFLLFALDVLRTPGQLASDDRRFQAEPQRADGLWDVGILPDDASAELLGLEDDLRYRRLAGRYATVEPGEVDAESTPELEALRARTRRDVARASRREREAARQARLLTMLAVLGLAEVPSSAEERTQMLREAAAIFRRAVGLDPSNVDAMANLEAALGALDGGGR